MIGVFVEWDHAQRRRKDSPGWVIDGNGCHIWTGAKTTAGYGQVSVDGGKRLVHRMRYEREVGPIPAGLHLDHFYCENQGCCNPAHVRPVTPRENVLRSESLSSLNLAKTHCPKGHELSGVNSMVDPQGGRKCRTCHNQRRQRRRKIGTGPVFALVVAGEETITVTRTEE